jgi:hypothetical protein
VQVGSAVRGTSILSGIGCKWDQHSKWDRQYVGHRLRGYRAGGRGGGAGGAGQTQARAHSAKRRDSHSFRPHRPTNTRASCLHPRQSVAASASPAAEAALPDGASVSPGADAAWPAGRGRASGSRRQCPRRGSRAAGSAIGMPGALGDGIDSIRGSAGWGGRACVGGCVCVCVCV